MFFGVFLSTTKPRQIETLSGDKKELEMQVSALKVKCEEIEAREAERRAMDERKFTEEIAILKRTNQQLKNQLESILAPAKK